MPYAYGYVRVSHYESAKSGLSVAVQSKAIVDHYDRVVVPNHPDLTVVERCFVDEVVSGWKTHLSRRPAGSHLWRTLRRGDHICAYKADRLFRTIKDTVNTMERFESMGVTVHLCDVSLDMSTPMGKCIMYMMGCFAQMESELKSERAKDIAAHLKAAGGTGSGGGRRPPGKKRKGPKGRRYWEEVADERAILAYIVELRDEWSMTWQQVSNAIESKLQNKPANKIPNSTRTWYRSRCALAYEIEKRHREEERAALDEHVKKNGSDTHGLDDEPSR